MLRAISARAFCLLLCRRSAFKAAKPKDKTEISEIDAAPLSKELKKALVLPSSEKFMKQTRLPVLNARERCASSASLTCLRASTHRQASLMS